ncbi:MAG: DUF418 domain-containing protein [Chloroflexi bacterium]|nr:DUF418 domain-containing protein [Chloroflexota bacterium]
MAAAGPTTETGPVSEQARIASLDLTRGIAVLGILLMNAVSFRFVEAAYYNLSAAGSETWLDWAVGIFGEVFVDQKFMGMFSLLFGAGVMLFIDRAAQRGRPAVLLHLWRSVLLLAMGIAHFQLWYGDVLWIYAVSAFILIALRKLPDKALLTLGVAVFMLSVTSDLYAQALANAGAPLGGTWHPTEVEDFTIGYLSWASYIVRGPGMVLIGAALFRMGFMAGGKPAQTYRITAILGLGIGLPLAALGVVITALGDFANDVALISQVPNNLGTIPASLGYVSLIILWSNGAENWLKRRLRAVGRMALTNYLTQSILGVLVLTILLGDVDFVNRSAVVVFVFAVWALQMWWSHAWLSRYQFGPVEWLWRTATYRSVQPLRRPN